VTRVKCNETSDNYFQSRTSEYKPKKEFQIKVERYELSSDDCRFEVRIYFDDTSFPVFRTSEEIKSLCTILLDKYKQSASSASASSDVLRSLHLSNDESKLRIAVNTLNAFFSSLLESKDILLSSELLLFLDPELESYKDYKDQILLEPECVHSILLSGYNRETKTVKKYFTQSFKIKKSEYLIWSFTTANYDIGFSIDMDGMVQVPMIRYKARDGFVMGALEAIGDGQCTLKWDNSYSKCEFTYYHFKLS
jgi:hypothetical protein